MRSAAQRVKSPVREFLKAQAPWLWIHWHLARCADSVEPEVSILKYVIPRNGAAVDVGANYGIYTRELARLANVVHAFEPSNAMARILRSTSASNVIIHELALSDRTGVASLHIPKGEDGLIHSLASVEENVARKSQRYESIKVPLATLDSIVRDDVTFVKIDVEGHELKVLEGARGVIGQSRAIFLVEAEERHRRGASSSVFKFFRSNNYRGFFLRGHEVLAAEAFDVSSMQRADSLNPDGSRKPGRHYVNNFFFFPLALDGRDILRTGLEMK